MKKTLHVIMLSALLSTGFNVNAQGMNHSSHGSDHAAHSAGDSTKTTDKYTKATVRKIDKINGKITLKHEEIKNLDMPSMTMVFVLKVEDKAVLDSINVGDEVNAVFDKTNEGFVVTEIMKNK